MNIGGTFNYNIGGVNVSGTAGVGSVEVGKLNISDLMYAVMAERAMLLDSRVREQADEVKAKNAELKRITEFMGKARASQIPSQNVVDKNTWKVQDKTIVLDNGYKIEIEGKGQAWKLTDEQGNYVRVWGDPHVAESDAPDKHWDFKETATFVLEDGTKITVNTKPYGSNAAVTDSLTITKGNQAIVVNGIAENNPVISPPSLKGLQIDANTNDGQVFEEMGDVASWSFEGEGKEIVGKAWSQRETYVQTEITYEKLTEVPSMGDDLKDFLNANNIAFNDPEGDGALTPQEWDNLARNLKGLQESLTSTSQLDMAQLQASMNKYNQTFEMMSNFTAKFFQSLNAITGNIR